MTDAHRLADVGTILLATIVGVGSIILFVIGEPIRVLALNGTETNLLLWDAGLCLLFFAQHSIMVRIPFRKRVMKAIPPRYGGALYAIASGIALSAVALFWQGSATSILTLQGIPRMVARAVSLLGVLLFILGALAIRPFDPLGIGPIRAHLDGVEVRPGPLVVRGPYKWMRHPLYAAVLMMFWANPDVTSDRLLFNVLWTGWMIAATLLEERDLVREFGNAYREYQQNVPMLIPWRGSCSVTIAKG